MDEKAVLGSTTLLPLEQELVSEQPAFVEPIEETELLPLPQWAQSQTFSGKNILEDVYFDFNRWAIPDEMQTRLIEHGQWLKMHPKLDVLIAGHCDARGSREYNMVLGEKRAKSVKSFLADLGVENRIDIISYGKEEPSCFTNNESCHKQNRRAHFSER